MKIIITSEEELKILIAETTKKMFNECMTSKESQAEFGGLELAEEITGLKRPTIYSMCSLGKIPVIHVGSKLRFSRSELTKWMAEKNKSLR